MPTVTVITASVGHDTLPFAIESVQRQKLDTETKVTHLIVVDGSEYEESVRTLIDSCDTSRVETRVFVLPENTGGDGYLCHRIYGAMPLLVNTDFVTYFDEDNIMEPNHIQSLLNAITSKGSRWGYTLRTIVDSGNTELCKDLCESLGMIMPTCLHEQDRHIDTNCYMMQRELAVQLAPIWHRKTREKKPEGLREADREVAMTLIQNEPKGACTRDFTLRYRVANREDSVTAAFFENGNARHPSFDLSKPDLYLFYFMDKDTQDVLDDDKHALVSKLKMTYNVFDGYKCMRGLPDDARVLCLISDPLQYLDVLRHLKQATHHAMTRTIVLTKEIHDLPKDFSPVYADTVMSSYDFDLSTKLWKKPNAICADASIPDDLVSLATTDGDDAIFKIVNTCDIEKTLSEGYVPLAWRNDTDTLSDSVMDLEGASWVDLSRCISYCEKHSIEGTRAERAKEFLHMNHYLNDDIAAVMYQRICDPIWKAIDTVMTKI